MVRTILVQEPVTLKALQSLLGVRRCFGPEEDTHFRVLLERSLDFQEEVTNTLGEQVRRAVEVLIQALGRADQDRNGELLKDIAPAELYEAGLTVMMRLVFLLSAEERGLLLLGDPLYDQHYAISTLRAKLYEDATNTVSKCWNDGMMLGRDCSPPSGASLAASSTKHYGFRLWAARSSIPTASRS